MTLTMADSIYPANLPAGYDAYLGYVDGQWATAPALRAMFPGAHVLTLTVFGGTAKADGCDVESGDLTPLSGAEWVIRQLAAGAFRPVIYASAYTMRTGILPGLAAAGIARRRVRLLSAHYLSPLGAHICGPATCREVPEPMDGTQYTDSARGAGGQLIDASLLAADFFGTPPAPSPVPAWQEAAMHALPLVTEGSTDTQAVRTVQGLLCARGHAVTVDGAFGPATLRALEDLQQARGLARDGKCGPSTWPALLGVA